MEDASAYGRVETTAIDSGKGQSRSRAKGPGHNPAVINKVHRWGVEDQS